MSAIYYETTVKYAMDLPMDAERQLLSSTITRTYEVCKKTHEHARLFRATESASLEDPGAFEDLTPFRLIDLRLWEPGSWLAGAFEPSLPLITSTSSSSQEVLWPERSIPDLIAYCATELQVGFSERLARRLQSLVWTCQEEFPRQEPISPRSLEDFILFVELNVKLAYPNVVLTQTGNIRAEWRKSRNHFWGVEFLANGDVRFVLFAPDPRHPSKTTRAAGLASYDAVMELVRPYGVYEWIFEKREEGD
jgi:hypothetical protein